MNQGIFGFPSSLGGNILSTKEIDVSGTYLIAPGTKRLIIFAVGGGGGGGAGGKRASGTAHSGGAGGAGGSLVYRDFNVEDLGGVNTTLSITIGAGGLAGAIAGDTTAGGAGGLGGTTTITPTGKPGVLIHCVGGGGGPGGTNATVAAATVTNGYFYGVFQNASAGGGSNGTTGVGVNVGILGEIYHSGAGGSGLATTPVALTGGGVFYSTSGGTVCSPDTTRGQFIYTRGTNTITTVNPRVHILGNKMSPGLGGNGGGSGTTGGTPGADGYRGSGAGGGGSTLNTFTAGAGGVGGNGYVCIIAVA